MTEKIIINDVDVSGCEFFFKDNINGIFTQDLCACMEEHTGIDSYKTECRGNPNCHFKQLQRLTAQYNAVVEQNKSLQDELKTKDQECERMRISLNKIRNYELASLDIDWDEYETHCRETEYSPIIDYCEVGLGEVEDD